jgi:hypothetical protein
MRSPSKEEKELITRFAEKLGHAEKSQLLADISHATAHEVTSDGSRIAFEIDDYQRPEYSGQHTFTVEGRMLDLDNAELSVCLYADANGK